MIFFVTFTITFNYYKLHFNCFFFTKTFILVVAHVQTRDHTNVTENLDLILCNPAKPRI